jgi:hypothetical protein
MLLIQPGVLIYDDVLGFRILPHLREVRKVGPSRRHLRR